ncbi:MAG: hypothetical protein ACI4CS_10780 [Candidatus Weimeria sp.]
MKKKILSSIIIVVVCSFMLIESAEMDDVTAQEDTYNDWTSYGRLLADSRESVESNVGTKIVFQGENKNANVTVAELAQGAAFYKSNRNVSNAKSLELAAQYYKEYNSLYARAIESGYGVTSEEVDSYVSKLKKSFEKTGVNEEAKQVYKQVSSSFENMEAYWDYEKQVYMKSLPIQKMNADLMDKFYKENPGDSDEEFTAYYNKFKKKLVEEENYKQLINDTQLYRLCIAK